MRKFAILGTLTEQLVLFVPTARRDKPPRRKPSS
jgi:hypothetical protein